jgi:outer membrane protein assembly factor BamA
MVCSRLLQRYMPLIWFCLILAVVRPGLVWGAEPDSGTEESSGVVLYPIVGYTPETGFNGGGNIMYYRNLPPLPSGQKVDTIIGTLIFTEKSQFSANCLINKYFQGDRYLLVSEIYNSLYPNLFYGIGPDTRAAVAENYTLREFTWKGSFRAKVAANLYMGPSFQYSRFDTEDFKANGLLKPGDIPGSWGATAAGVGCNLYWEGRDQYFYPRHGSLTEIKALAFGKELGGSENFTMVNIDLRQYLPVAQNQVLAFQEYLAAGSGQVPFEMMPQLGGSNLMRGYFAGRYRDKTYLAAQVEYRFPIGGRFSGAVFGSAGQVAPSLANLDLQNLKFAGGAGIRFAVNTSQKINLRLDFGYGPEGIQYYICATEAF